METASLVAALPGEPGVYGWGHQFLDNPPFLRPGRTGFEGIRFYEFGESDDPELRGLERHGTPVFSDGWRASGMSRRRDH